MKKAALLLFVPLLGALALFVLLAARFESTIDRNCFLGPVSVGGLTKSQALTRLQAWWQSERLAPITLEIEKHRLSVPLEATGLTLDFSKSIAQLPMTELFDSARAAAGNASSSRRFDVKFVAAGEPAKSVVLFVEKRSKKAVPARVYYRDGQFDRIPNQPGMAIDNGQFADLTANAISTGSSTVEVPLAQALPTVSSADLIQIDSVISSFTTHFPVRKKDRNTNIRIAAGKINGWVLLPGERFSFNNVVGRRTIEEGFKEAPVFKDGTHAIDVGGGICQVSTTLYNSALFADLKIVQRHNHSMPVAYVPLGRDATVDYGSLDLAIQNNMPTPIALSSDYHSGVLTFRVLGKKDPSLKVKIVTSDAQSWSAPTKKVQDPKIPVGVEKILEKGSRGRSILSFRLVYKDGKLLAKEPLGRSYYRGGERIVAVGSGPPAPTPGAAPGVIQPRSDAPSAGAPIQSSAQLRKP